MNTRTFISALAAVAITVAVGGINFAAEKPVSSDLLKKASALSDDSPEKRELLDKAFAENPGSEDAARAYLGFALRRFDYELVSKIERKLASGGDEPWKLYARGLCMSGLGLYENASVLLGKAHDAQPDSGEYFDALADALEGGRFDQRLEKLYDSRLDWVKKDLLRACRYAEFLFYDLGRLDEGLTVLDEAASAFPKDVSPLYDKASMLLFLGEELAARSAIDNALEVAPGDPRTNLLAAEIYGPFIDAGLVEGNESLVNGYYAAAFKNLGDDAGVRLEFIAAMKSAYRSEEVRTAAKAFTKEQRLNCFPVVEFLAFEASRQGDFQEAAALLGDYLRLHPGDPSANMLLYTVAGALDKPDEALLKKSASAALRAAEHSVRALAEVLGFPWDEETSNRLLHMAEKRYETDPAHHELVVALARFYLQNGKAELAGKILERYRTLRAPDAEIAGLEEKLLLEEKKRQIYPPWERCVEKRPRDLMARERFAVALTRSWKFDEALIQWNALLEKRPHSARFMLGKALLYLQFMKGKKTLEILGSLKKTSPRAAARLESAIKNDMKGR